MKKGTAEMKIIVVGCGKIGEALVGRLNAESHDITVVDEDHAKVQSVANKYDALGIVGNGATRDVLQEAGVNKADLLIAVTGSDEINLLCCLMAKKRGNCRTIARVKSPEYFSDAPYLKEELGLEMIINPEYATASEITRILNFPSAINIETFAKGRVELLKFKLPEGCPLVGMSVREIIVKMRCNVLFCTVERGEEAFIANGEFVFAEKDVVSIISTPRSANAFFKKIGLNIQPVRDVLMLGGGELTHYLCDMLKRSGISLKIIERSAERAGELAEEFDYVTIINANPSDEDVLREEGIAGAGAVVALTKHDEENILLSLFAKRESTGKVVTRIRRTEYDSIVSQLELDSTVYPTNIVADNIARYVRTSSNTRGNDMQNLYNVIKGKVVAAEFIVAEGSPLINKPLTELDLKPDVLIAAILRDRSVIIPRGSDLFMPGDSVIIVTKHLGIQDLTDIIKK